MSKTILLIENDAPFATEMSGALEAMGYLVRVTGDGKEGFDLAKDLRPDAIVLCVELPKLSGYSICNKLKKDEQLKGIPLILTSSEATEEVFEDHRKLKVRAEDYLIKPFVSAALLEKLAELVGHADGPPAAPPRAHAAGVEETHGEEEVVSLEEEMGLDPFGGEPGHELPALDLDSLPDEPAAAAAGGDGLDDDLKLLDDAFDGLSTPGAAPAPRGRPREPARTGAGVDARAADEAIEKALGVDRPVTSEDLEAASASLPDDDEAEARADLGGLNDDADLALGSLGDVPAGPAPSAFDALDALEGLDESLPGPAPSPLAAPLAVAGPAIAAAAVAAAAGAAMAPGGGAGDQARLEAALQAREAELRELKVKLQAASRRADGAESALGEKEAEASSLKARAETVTAQVKRAEADARAARELARELESKVSSADGRCRAAEQDAAAQRRAAEQAAASLAANAAEVAAAQASTARLAEVERELERLETELLVARGEVDGARSEVDKRSADLKRRVSELEAANAKNEERVVKAYLKIKGDEKVRDKARKALAIALQLLEEGLPAEAPGEKRAHHPE